jgi:hypothetical protein
MGEATMTRRLNFGLESEQSGSNHVPSFRLDGSRLVFDDPRLNQRKAPPISGTGRAGKDKGRSKRKG